MDFYLVVSNGRLVLVPINPFAVVNPKLPKLKSPKTYWKNEKNERRKI